MSGYRLPAQNQVRFIGQLKLYNDGIKPVDCKSEHHIANQADRIIMGEKE